MTGFGRADFEADGVAYEVEIRSVNHRYLDLRIRLPRTLADREPAVKARVQERLRRGKVDLSVTLSAAGGSGLRIEIDQEAAGRYAQAARSLARAHGLPGELDVASLLALPGVARSEEPRPGDEAVDAALLPALGRALDALEAMREAEGAALGREIQGRLDRVLALGGAVEARAGEVARSVRDRLRKRADTLRNETGLLDEARLHQEIVLAADRLDVTEEIVRLRSHVDQFRSILAGERQGEPMGRRLDFLLQELSREANTIGSKGSDAPIAHDVVELKTELERIREQVQNLE